MKYALITGASRGIGRSVALLLAERYSIIINYQSNADMWNFFLSMFLIRRR